MKKILVVDDDPASGELLEEIFSAEGWNTLAAQTPQRARELVGEQKFDLVVSDINLEADENGLDLLRSLRKECPIILVTGFGSLETAIEATHEGAYDFISKPFKVEEVVAAARRALGGSKHAIDAAAEPTYEADQTAVQDEITGRSPAMIRLYLEIARIARSRVTVLITGESGTGKELIARSIHKHSSRAASEFVPVNCGALTETLLEAELFGAMKGSYTGENTDGNNEIFVYDTDLRKIIQITKTGMQSSSGSSGGQTLSSKKCPGGCPPGPAPVPAPVSCSTCRRPAPDELVQYAAGSPECASRRPDGQ